MAEHINCRYYKDGECTKGLPGTRCELLGCVARIEYKTTFGKVIGKQKTN